MRQKSTSGSRPTDRAMDDDALAGWVRASAEPLAAYFGRLAAARPLVLIVPADGTTIDGETLGRRRRVGAPPRRNGRSRRRRPARAGSRPTSSCTRTSLRSATRTSGSKRASRRTSSRSRASAPERCRPKPCGATCSRTCRAGSRKPGDQGLEKTHTWGRTYWGGALFCLMADIAIRERTRGGKSFDDALRAIAGMGPGAAVRVDLGRALAAGDAATGTDVLQGLYRTACRRAGHGRSRCAVARARRFASSGRRVAYDDGAPLAWIRRAITAR